MHGEVSKMFSVIIQGPIYINDAYFEFLNRLLAKSEISEVISSLVSDSQINELKNIFKNHDKLRLKKITDIGLNNGHYRKPLNINRFFNGVKESLSLVTSRKVVILRSDIILNIDLLLLDYNKKKKDVVVLDVTSKSQFIRENWFDHYCDWLYILDKEHADKVFKRNNYEHMVRDLTPSEYGKLFPLAPERFLFLKIKETFTSGNIYKALHVVNHKKISLICLKPEYKEIPFGINRKYMILNLDNYLKVRLTKFINLSWIMRGVCFLRYAILYRTK